MSLDEAQLNAFLGVLERIDRGKAMPRFPDRIGRYLRQYKDGRLRLAELFEALGHIRRADGAISGSLLGTAKIHPLAEPKIGVLGFPLGEVADTIGISEELGGVVNVVMWLKSPMANAAHEILKAQGSVTLDGDYRWTPTARVAVGGAAVNAAPPVTWRAARCIKAVADDLGRPPHALEYVLDYRMGAPGIKFFRSVCVTKRGNALTVFPAFAEPTSLDFSGSKPAAVRTMAEGDASSLLVYCEPGSTAWTVVDSVPISREDAFSHVVAWADYQLELSGGKIDGEGVADLRKSWATAGFALSSGYANFNTEHRLLPVAHSVIRELRRI